MTHIRDLDPSASPLDYYGAELRRLREAADLNQKQLGSIIYCTGSLVGQIETARKVPTREFSERVDAALGTEGALSRLVGLVLRSQLPSWFQPYAELESRATYISTYQAQVVYGLLQTESYARAVLAAPSPDNLDELVAARIERQRILAREHPPLTWVVLDEAALYRPIGGRTVMRNQLRHLLDLRDQRRVNVQVLPFSAGEHTGLTGSFTLMRFGQDPDLLYTEDFVSGHATANPEAANEGSLRYARLQAAALSVEDSAALISRVMEERYGPEPEPDERGVA
ncbi:helix-turn-helix domain-containing protein [Streptomyces lunaelactis]|uniref:helix-turn-helix domain-containing protein n=1 Tax=Streptomyces lunaelactis TaxID=1535768 RepID=UPI0015846839|nr:helix-turn-helix transcriptional regulator [Streptomyces lunaelactis]NUK21393.1 helix-turn-helix domain-containing protein [Streptomyces lunaelactis]NUK35871.1 helix-turn-helix domain-containing protein [Streptomyces lunaelactis]NUK42649.1 helix-turn-helix domain-containing protein [Streptomyces lunaelactis]NUL28633.1 helix-turn-helix domain-containing protein [Streptomyces lunaelactis]